MQSEYLLIGEITRPQGVRGEMRVRPYTDDPMRFEDLDEVYVKRGDKYEARGITFVRLNSDDAVIIRMDGVGDANAVEALRGEKYGSWFAGYISEEYRKTNQALIDRIDALSAEVDEEKAEHFCEIFEKCFLFDLRFWDLVYTMEGE